MSGSDDAADPSVGLHIPGHVATSHVPPEAARVGLMICLDGSLILAKGQDALVMWPNAEAWDAIARNAAEMAELERNGTLARIRRDLLADVQRDAAMAAEPAGNA